jgi:NDP-sugar pyrophosphorylase family protein
MDALILAGGLGTRMGLTVIDTPKVMLNVHGKPFLEWLILDLKRKNFSTVVISVSYLADKIIDYFGSGHRYGLKIKYSIESKPLGTGGAVLEAMNIIETENCLIMNGDSYCDYDFNRFHNFYVYVNATALMGLVRVVDQERYGSVIVSDNNLVSSFLEKNQDSKTGLHNINAGIYIINKKRYIDNAKYFGKSFSIEREYFPSIIGSDFYGLNITNSFIDIGIPDSYYLSSSFMEQSEVVNYFDKYFQPIK